MIHYGNTGESPSPGQEPMFMRMAALLGQRVGSVLLRR